MKMKITRIILFGLLGGTSTVGAIVLLMLIQPLISALIPGRSPDQPGHLEPPADVQLATQGQNGAEPELEPEPEPVVETASEPEPEPEPEAVPAEEPKQVAIAKPQPQASAAPKPKPVVKAAVALPPPPPPPPVIPAAPPAPVQ